MPHLAHMVFALIMLLLFAFATACMVSRALLLTKEYTCHVLSWLSIHAGQLANLCGTFEDLHNSQADIVRRQHLWPKPAYWNAVHSCSKLHRADLISKLQGVLF
jgi:hypothetical protein